jgi:hypothetical protein
MRAIVLGLILAQTATVAFAQSRPSTETMTCSQAQSFVASRGAVLMSTGPTTYDRFVSGRIGCSGNDVAEPAYVRTRDNPQCALYVCQGFRRGGGG